MRTRKNLNKTQEELEALIQSILEIDELSLEQKASIKKA